MITVSNIVEIFIKRGGGDNKLFGLINLHIFTPRPLSPIHPLSLIELHLHKIE